VDAGRGRPGPRAADVQADRRSENASYHCGSGGSVDRRLAFAVLASLVFKKSGWKVNTKQQTQMKSKWVADLVR
jgi:hypothetical protein